MKYSENFERDYNWYLNNKEVFNFDGTKDYFNKKGENLVCHSESGFSAKECFYAYDTNGKVLPCKEPKLLYSILKCKGSINFNIKQWAEDRAKGYLGSVEFDEYCKELNLLPWMKDAVENQKVKYYLNIPI